MSKKSSWAKNLPPPPGERRSGKRGRWSREGGDCLGKGERWLKTLSGLILNHNSVRGQKGTSPKMTPPPFAAVVPDDQRPNYSTNHTAVCRNVHEQLHLQLTKNVLLTFLLKNVISKCFETSSFKTSLIIPTLRRHCIFLTCKHWETLLLNVL